MRQWGFWFDQQDCINCHACEIACKVWNEEKRGDARLYPLRELTEGSAGENATEKNYYMKERLRRSWYEERGNKPPDLMRYNMNISCNLAVSLPVLMHVPQTHIQGGYIWDSPGQ